MSRKGRGPSQKSDMGLEVIPEVRKTSGDTPGDLEGVGRPSKGSVMGLEVLPEVVQALPEVRVWL